MVGDVADFVRRMAAVLPSRWFASPTLSPQPPTLLQGLLSGFGVAWASIYYLLGKVQLLARLGTAFGPFLDMASVDFFGAGLPRRPLESDMAFRLRIHQELLRPRGTRTALILALTELTGRPPAVFEPARPEDTGGYSTGGVGYCIAGGYGNLDLPFACFVTAMRPTGGGIAKFAGYGTGGYSYYGDLAMVTIAVTDADVYATTASIMPAGFLAWTRVSL